MDWKTINTRHVLPAIEAARAGRVDEAERLFKEGLAASHEDGYVALRFAEFLESLKRSDDAVRLFELALRKLPKPEYKRKPKEGLDRLSSAPAPLPDALDHNRISSRIIDFERVPPEEDLIG